MTSITPSWFFFLGIFASAATSIAADPVDVKPLAARSVHLAYVPPVPAASYAAFYLEETVLKTTSGSYFQALGFSNGYFGIQDLEAGKVAIFSVWDPTTGVDPKAVKDEDRCEMVYVGENVRAKRFGGEGTGAQSFFDYPWHIGQPVKFYLTATAENKKTTYAAYIQMPDGKSWKHLATFRTRTGGKLLHGLYSFIEDFRRDTQSATEVRRAQYNNVWVRDVDGRWLPITSAKFTASGATWEAKNTIDAGVLSSSSFYLQTGGDTVKHKALESTLERSQDSHTLPPSVPFAPTTQN